MLDHPHRRDLATFSNGLQDATGQQVRMDRIAKKLRAEYTTQIGHRPAPSEVASWQDSQPVDDEN